MVIPEKTSIAVPTAFVIFGATGDLARQKLLPALFNLYTEGHLPDTFRIVGFSRDELSNEQFRTFAKEKILAKNVSASPQKIENFLATVNYQQGLFEEGKSYLALSEELIRLENKEFGVCSNKLFYLAVPPTYYETIFKNLAHSGLTIPCGGPDGWTRVLVEKPFGKDLATAQSLDKTLGLLFKEEQIFRIDHYLAKETLQNILAFRFANPMFAPLWDNEDIEKVVIRIWESGGVGTRGAFYEDVGALRDVGQNHLLQMLALIAMEDPGKISAPAIRRKRAAVLQALRSINDKEIAEHTVRGQYEGYRDEADVASASNIETYFRTRVFIDNDRWRGVPFYLESGKKMQEDKVEIMVYFRDRLTALTQLHGEERHQNVLTFRIQPNEGISLIFWAKKPGFGMELEPKKLSFTYQEKSASHSLPDAYEHVLYDCIRGDQTLFTSTEEVSAAWQFITPMIEKWQKIPLQSYMADSKGPESVRHKVKSAK